MTLKYLLWYFWWLSDLGLFAIFQYSLIPSQIQEETADTNLKHEKCIHAFNLADKISWLFEIKLDLHHLGMSTKSKWLKEQMYMKGFESKS